MAVVMRGGVPMMLRLVVGMAVMFAILTDGRALFGFSVTAVRMGFGIFAFQHRA